ncbi:MAG: KH domain-containing protein, partial [Nitrospiraceae bacterium]|nr:KH domain-containing protein [Nitrospiraceae bacterium]
AKVTGESTEDGGARLNVESEDSAILIGRKGRNLQALQYILNRMMRGADAPDTVERFIVDIEDYLERRRDSLEEMAEQLAIKAKETGKEVRVKPLNPQERRIIHLALQDDPDLRTFSLGNTSMRTIVISPKNADRENTRSRRSRGGSRRGRRGGRQRNDAPRDVQPAVEADAAPEQMAQGDAQGS